MIRDVIHTFLPPQVAVLSFRDRTGLVGQARDAMASTHMTGGFTAVAMTVLAIGAGTLLVASVVRARPADRPGLPWVCVGLQFCGLVAIFVALAYLASSGGGRNGTDSAVLSWFTEHRTAWVTGPAIAVTDAGGPVGTALVAVLIGGWLSYRARSPIPGVVMVATVGAAALASTVAKSVVGRSRPPVISQVLLETDHSFPSGHATGATALLVTAAVLIGSGLPAARRRALLIAAIVVSAVVALTRLYLGEHWLTDVIGGMVLGGLAALVGTALYAAWVQRSGGGTDPHAVVAARARLA